MGRKQSLNEAVRGVGVTPATPFGDDLTEVDFAGLEGNLQFLVVSGVEMLYPAGNTGEVMSLSAEEWTGVVEVAVDVAGKEACVVPGISHELPVAVELARRASGLGADGLLLMPRTQPYISSKGLIHYWRAIRDVTDLPVVLYLRGLPDLDDLVEELGDDDVVACKYADKDISRFASAVSADESGIAWTCGIAERYAPYFWRAGSVGFTSGLANFAPALSLRLQQLLEEGQSEPAEELSLRCLPFEEIRARNGDSFNVAAVKAAMDRIGLAGGRVRPPLVDLDEAAAHDLTRALPSLETVEV
mgnify:FL=1